MTLLGRFHSPECKESSSFAGRSVLGIGCSRSACSDDQLLSLRTLTGFDRVATSGLAASE